MVAKSTHSLEIPANVQRAAAYVRVSTNRQAEHETSLADQVAAITSYCDTRNIEVAEVFREPRASATDDNRPQFQAMIEAATARERPFDVIIVHSFSRFFRDQFEFERYRRKLAKAKVNLVSITQDVGEGATGDLVRSILSKFDEYQSAETAKHVRRSMIANARDGFWNGSSPPLGCKVMIAERRGDKDKKVLAIDENRGTGRSEDLLAISGGRRSFRAAGHQEDRLLAQRPELHVSRQALSRLQCGRRAQVHDLHGHPLLQSEGFPDRRAAAAR